MAPPLAVFPCPYQSVPSMTPAFSHLMIRPPDPFPEHRDQMVAVVEEPPDVGVNDPVDLPPFHSDRDGIERMMRPGRKP